MRQVTHALLTRPPLSHNIFTPEEDLLKCFVRLACVKHAASVHPEPGSNSHVHVWSLVQGKTWLSLFRSSLLWCLLFLGCNLRCCSYDSQNLSRLFHCLVINVHLLSFLATALIFYHFSVALSTTFSFYFFASAFLSCGQLIYNIIRSISCQELFWTFSTLFFALRAEKEGFEPSRRY